MGQRGKKRNAVKSFLLDNRTQNKTPTSYFPDTNESVFSLFEGLAKSFIMGGGGNILPFQDFR